MKTPYKAIKTPRSEVTPEYVRDCLSYDPDTGTLTWKNRPESHFPTLRGCRIFHAVYAGKATGCKDRQGYLVVLIGGRPYAAHRLAWAIMTGSWPSEMIDHVNGVRDDNRFENLRKATRAENRRNSVVRRDNTSGVKGVGKPIKRADGSLTWRAMITTDGVKKHVGYFPSLEKAEAAVKAAREKLHLEFTHHG